MIEVDVIFDATKLLIEPDEDDDEPIKLKILDNVSNNHLGIELLEPEILDESENLLSGFIEELH